MREIYGDFWVEAVAWTDHHSYRKYDGLVVLTNTTVRSDGMLTMGRGQAKQAADRYLTLAGVWGRWYADARSDGYGVIGTRVFMDESEHWMISFPTKHDWRQPAQIHLIEAHCHQLVQLVTTLELTSVLLPRPGCGLGGLHWDDVKPICEAILSDDRFTVITYGAKS